MMAVVVWLNQVREEKSIIKRGLLLLLCVQVLMLGKNGITVE